MSEARFEVHVSALARLLADAERIRPTHALSLIDPGTPAPDLAVSGVARHVVLHFRDTNRAEDPTACTPEQLGQVLAFLAEVTEAARERATRFLVHCAHGQSRSPAVAYVALALHLGPGREREAFRAMRQAAPHCWPNVLLVAQADAALGRGGALVAPLTAFRSRFRPPSGARFL